MSNQDIVSRMDDPANPPPPPGGTPNYQQAPQKFCAACGTGMHPAAAACPRCGAPQAVAGGKSRIAAAILAFFLGGIGAHKFYLGQIGMGLLYLLFCWTFIPGIIAFIEFIILLCTSDADFNAKYNRT